jgi:phage-related protein (TIGR01555 family)
MAALLNDNSEFGEGDSVIDRLKLANALRDNYSIFALDNNEQTPEEWQQFTLSLAGFSEVLSQNAELICATTQIPAIIMFGTSPKGFNSSGDIELRVWYDRVRGYQNSRLLPHLRTAYDYIQLDLFGEIDEDLTVEFKPLWTPSELEQSQIQLNKQQRNSAYVADGTLLREEVRASLLEDPHSGYNTLLSEDEYLANNDEPEDEETAQA